MNTAVPWFFVLLAVMLGGVTLLVFLFVASRIFGNRSGGGVPPRRASDDLSPIGAVPSPLGDDSLTNPANPLYHLHHLGATSDEPHRHHHDPSPGPSSFDAPSGGGASSDTSSSPPSDSGSSMGGGDSGGNNCG